MRRARYWTIGAGCVVLALVVGSACGDDSTDTTPEVSILVASATGSAATPPAQTPTPTQGGTPTPLAVCAPNPDPASTQVLQIEQPQPNQKVKQPVQVRGWGSNIGFKDQGVALAIVDAKQDIKQVLNLPPQPRTYRVPPPGLQITGDTRPFAADVLIDVNAPTPFCLWVYQQTTAAGEPKGVVQVPILVTP